MDRKKRMKILTMLGFYTAIVILTNIATSHILNAIGNIIFTDQINNIYYVVSSQFNDISPLLSILSYAIPSIAIVIYMIPLVVFTFDKNPAEKLRTSAGQRILSMPFLSSSMSLVGWIFSMISIIALTLMSNVAADKGVYIYLVLNSIVSGFFCFTISFFILDSLNRKILIPIYFDKDSIFSVEKAFRFPIKLRFFIFFFSTVVFPLTFLFLYVMRIVDEYNTEWLHYMQRVYLVIFASFVGLGYALTALFSAFFQHPLKKLAKATTKIKQGEYDIRLKVESNDEIGILQDSVMDMASKIRDSSEKLKEYNLYLEDQVAKRTRDLVQAEKMASLGQLTAGIAHEIKNPLNFVNNFAQISLEILDELQANLREPGKSRDEEIADAIRDLKTNLSKINEHGRRADRIVWAMLQHSRGETGIRQPANLNQLIEEYLNLAYHGMRAQDPGFNIAIEKHLDPAIPELSLVPQEIGRALLNLFNNAFYSTRKKGLALRNRDAEYAPTLSVSTSSKGGFVTIAIRDNGEGIEPSIRNKIFEPFFTTKPTGEGVGLGLSISYDIVVNEHKGSIEIDSATEPADSFCEFAVKLPVNA
jgi:signal transduction histidine kinase